MIQIEAAFHAPARKKKFLRRWHGLNINDPERDELKTARSRKRQFETHRSRKG